MSSVGPLFIATLPGLPAIVAIFTLDMDQSRGREQRVDVSSEPTADPSIISDNATVQPPTLSFEGVISEFPLSPFADRVVSLNRLAEMEDRIFDLQAQKTFWQIQTDLNVFSDYMLTGLSSTRTADEGQQLRVTLDFLHVATVLAIETILPPLRLDAAVEPSAAPVVNLGTVSATPATEQDTTLLGGAVDGFIAVTSGG